MAQAVPKILNPTDEMRDGSPEGGFSGRPFPFGK
jgi:hypothetical protein